MKGDSTRATSASAAVATAGSAVFPSAKHGGGESKPGEQTAAKSRHGAGKIFSPKEAELMQDILHIRRELEREAAYEELCDEELCRQLTGQFARESARKTGDAIGDIRDRYDAIVMEFTAARYAQTDGKRYSLGTVLRDKYKTDTALKEFLPKFGKWIGEYVSDCIRQHILGFTPLYRQIVPTHTWTLSRHCVSRDLLTALAEEYVRDREGLLRFICAVFKRWRKIDQPHSAWRVKLVTEQHANDVSHHKIAQRLEKIDAVPKGTVVPGTSAYRKLRSTIKQIRSRDRKAAWQRRGR
jgi:hypothetical protein